MMSPQFHSIAAMGDHAPRAANVRSFTGDGTPYLRVPGLTEVTSVRVGAMEIPLALEQEFPDDHTHRRFTKTTLPLVHLTEDGDGCSILLRSAQSNDGIWQDGETIYVGGVWADGKPVEPDAEAQILTTLNSLEFKELKALAESRGIAVRPGTSAEQLRGILVEA